MNDYQTIPFRRPIRTRRPLLSRLARWCFRHSDTVVITAILAASTVLLAFLLRFFMEVAK